MVLVVSAIGMISSLGYDLQTSCAAIRAGLSRAQPVTHFHDFDEEEHETIALTGHAIRGITDGFTSVGRWLQLVRYAFEDMVRQGNLPSHEDRLFWSRTAAFVVAPSPDQPRFYYDDLFHPDSVNDTYVRPLFAAIGHPELLNAEHFLPLDAPGVVIALDQATKIIREGAVERVLIVGADSLLDAMALEGLGEGNALKGLNESTGLVPGEGGVALMVETPGAVERRRGKTYARISAHALEMEDLSENDDKPLRGHALGRAVVNVLGQTGVTGGFTGTLLTDLNGEEWRAYEYGMMRSLRERELPEDCGVVSLAGALGDTGAAAGMMGIGYASWALGRNCARTDRILVTTSAESGIVGAVIVERAG
jgi:3-oxoacyl-[acyl-carrier-protein] synthase I